MDSIHTIKQIQEQASGLDFNLGLGIRERIYRYEDYLFRQREAIKKSHDKGDSGLHVAAAHASLIDTLIRHLIHFAISSRGPRQQDFLKDIALVGLLGYGQNFVCPNAYLKIALVLSDRSQYSYEIGILFEHEVCYILRQMGFNLTAEIGTISQLIKAARQRNDFCLNLSLGRLVIGSEDLFKEFHKMLREYAIDPYFDKLLADLQSKIKQRRAKWGDTVFVREPDVLTGIGGIEDITDLLILANLQSDCTSLEDIHKQGVIKKSEYRQLKLASEFLIRIRNELHFLSNSDQNLLSMKLQPCIAEKWGYKNAQSQESSSALMKDFFIHAKSVARATSELALKIQPRNKAQKKFNLLRFLSPDWKQNDGKNFDGLVLRNGVLSAFNQDIFKEDLSRIVRVFRYAKEFASVMDIGLSNLIRETLVTYNFDLSQNAEVNKSFSSVLMSLGNVYRILHDMHQLGVLCAILPEFRLLRGAFMIEVNHEYSIDIHILDSIRELDKISSTHDSNSNNYKVALYKTSSPHLLYWIILLHDITYAQKSEKVESIISPILNRFELSDYERSKILFAVENRHEMMRFWQRFDIDDPRAVDIFARFIEDKDNLRNLYVHDFCDIRSTGPREWSSHSELLHLKLFQYTLERLNKKDTNQDLPYKERFYKALLKKRNLSESTCSTYIETLPERYFYQSTVKDCCSHLELIKAFKAQLSKDENNLIPTVKWEDDIHNNCMRLHIVAKDRRGLFCTLVGALYLSGLNILSSRAFSCSNGLIIDVFTVERQKNLIETENSFRNILRQAFDPATDFHQLLNNEFKKNFHQKSHEPCDPKVNIFQEYGINQTIIEIQSADSLGLLYRISRSLFEAGCDINFARALTQKDVALDTFHVSFQNTNNVVSPLAVREQILKAISPKE